MSDNTPTFRDISLLLALVLGLTLAAIAQHDDRCTIRGTVREVESGDPIEFANVYLASTTFGTAADAKGEFVLRGIPPGTYQLVASRVGFSPKAVTVQCTPGATVSKNFTLQSRILSGEGMDVEAPSREEWKRDFSEFRDEFVGTDEFGAQCTILNYDALVLRRDPETQELTASSFKPIEVVNMGLGYRVNVDLQTFTSRKQEGRILYEVFTRFEEIPTQDSSQLGLWQRNREKAYKGSRMHFLRAVALGKSDQERFRVYRGELRALRELRGTYAGPALEGIVSTVGGDMKQLSWQGFLRVEYQGEEGWTNNIFQLTQSPVYLESSGYLHNPTAFVVLTESPWGRDRLGKMLPLNYGQ
jgi:hypothetical protein